MHNLNRNTEILIRQLYTVLYLWHREHGHRTVTRIIASNKTFNQENNNVEKYQLALKEMPQPENASLEQIEIVAGKVNGGILEWNYGERGNNDIILGDNAKRILALFNEAKISNEIEKLKEGIFAVIDNEIQSDNDYFKNAIEIYAPILLDNEKNIGGRVPLTDTNWEFQKIATLIIEYYLEN